MICERTAQRLTELARTQGLGVEVRVAESTRPKRRWYSVGSTSERGWHQCSGHIDAEGVMQDLRIRVENVQKSEEWIAAGCP